jgi:hypothetical protein
VLKKFSLWFWQLRVKKYSNMGDTGQMKELVKKQVDLSKEYKSIPASDIIHVCGPINN